MATNSSLYDILGVLPTATFDEIKVAYRRAAMRWHPDRNPGNIEEAEKRFKELAAAFAILSNPSKRDLYDSSKDANEIHEEAEEDPEVIFLRAMFELAFNMAMKGYNKDVLVGALIATGCPDKIAEKIATETIARRDNKKPSKTTPHNEGNSTSSTSSTSSNLIIVASVILLSFGVAFATRDCSNQPGISNTPVSSNVSSAASRERTSLEDVISSQIESYDEQKAVGKISYRSFPKDELFNSYHEYIGHPFKIEPIKITRIDGTNLDILFLSSIPISKDGSDFSCHACSPILNAMLIEEDQKLGYSVIIPLHPLRPAGTWGKIDLHNDFSPTIINPGPKTIGFILKHRDMGQGHVVEWGSIHRIEKNQFSQLGEFHVHSDSFGSSQCEGVDQKECPQKDTRIRFDKTSIHNGYYDLVITEDSVDLQNGIPERVEKKFRMKFNGARYADVTSDSKQ